MKSLVVFLLFIASFTSYSQNLKYKKDVLPHLNECSNKGLNNAKLYHAQNTKSDGSLTDKALLTQYDNIYKVRWDLARCYDMRSFDSLNIAYSDTALYYAGLCKELYNGEKEAQLIASLQKNRKILAGKIKSKEDEMKNQKEAEEKFAYEMKYGLKSDTVKYVGGEFLGHCRVEFKTLNGESIVFYNPDLKRFGSSNDCQILDEAANKLFKIEYKLQSQQFYTEDVGSQVIETYVLQNIGFTNINEEQIFFDELERQKENERLNALYDFVDRNSGLPNRSPFICDNCNEMTSKKIDACNMTKVKDAIIHTYWGVREGKEYVFFENDTLLVYNMYGEYELIPYKMEICQNKKIGVKETKCVAINFTSNSYEYSRTLYLTAWSAGEIMDERGQVVIRTTGASGGQYLFLEELMRQRE